MKNWKKLFVLQSCLIGGLVLAVAGFSFADGEQPSKWSKAGEEIGEAAGAVGEASKETYEETKDKTVEMLKKAKEKSGEAWDATKEKSTELADKAREKVHEATAPPAAE